jgi:lysophospholipase L1-like esterase
MPAPRRLLRRLALIVGGLVLALGALELALRVAGYEASTPRWFDPAVGWRFFPDQVVTMVEDGVDLGTATIDAHGYRVPAHDPPHPSGTLAIAAVGDSVTFGWPVADDATWPVRLESRLAALRDGGAVRVRNFGVPGWNTVNQARQYPLDVVPWEPDVLLLSFVLNDVQPEDKGPIHTGGPIFALLKHTALLTAFHQHLRPHLPGFAPPQESGELTAMRKDFATRHGVIMGEPEGQGAAYWARATEALERLVTRARADGVRVGLIVFPSHMQVEPLRAQGAGPTALEPEGEWSWVAAPQRHLATHAARLELPMLDLLEPYLVMDEDPFHEQDPGHPGPAGLQVAADAMATWLHDLDWTGAP